MRRRVLAFLLAAGVLMPVAFVPSTVAPTHPGRFRGAGPAASPWLPAGQGEAFLTDVFGPNARITVWAAFGADVGGDPDLWQWYDITADVRQADGQRVNIAPMGRSDEVGKAQPAGCVFQLDNTSGDYTKDHPGSKWWPYVRRNTPIRVELNLTGLIADSVVRFQGQANGFKPSWDISGNLAIVTVSASGKLRQLQQGKSPLRSALYRAIILSKPAPALYLPCEDGASATLAASGLLGGINGAATVNPPVKFAAASTVAPGSGKLPDFTNGGVISAAGLPARTVSSWTVECAFLAPTTFPADLVPIASWITDTTGNVLKYTLWLGSSTPGLRLWINTNPADAAVLDVHTSDSTIYDGTLHHVRVTGVKAGANMVYKIYLDDVLVLTDSTTTNPIGAVRTVAINADAISGKASGPVGLSSGGHLAVYDSELVAAGFAVQDHGNALAGYPGENVVARLTRLCSEQGVPIAVVGTSDTTVGPQTVDTLISLLRECETTDDGLLYDGLGPGLGYTTRQARYNRAASISPDMAADPPQVADPFEPVDDDQRDRNQVTVTRKHGASATYEDPDGPLGTGEIGVYDATVSPDPNYADDAGNYFRAAHEVKKGTVPGYRYPSLNLNLAATPALAAAWLTTPLAGRIDVLNVASKATQHPPGTVSLLLEGYGESLSPFDWDVAANCSPFSPWRVAVLEGSDAEYRWRIASANSTLHQDYPAGTTSIQVDVNDGYLWSTDSGDYPRDLDVGGIQVTATAVSGAASPQTFTVNATSVRLLAGAMVRLWRTPTLAL